MRTSLVSQDEVVDKNCDGCSPNAAVPHNQRHLLHRLPRVLVVHIKRFMPELLPVAQQPAQTSAPTSRAPSPAPAAAAAQVPDAMDVDSGQVGACACFSRCARTVSRLVHTGAVQGTALGLWVCFFVTDPSRPVLVPGALRCSQLAPAAPAHRSPRPRNPPPRRSRNPQQQQPLSPPNRRSSLP